MEDWTNELLGLLVAAANNDRLAAAATVDLMKERGFEDEARKVARLFELRLLIGAMLQNSAEWLEYLRQGEEEEDFLQTADDDTVSSYAREKGAISAYHCVLGLFDWPDTTHRVVELSDDRLQRACDYLGEDRDMHQASSGRWRLDPGKLLAALCSR